MVFWVCGRFLLVLGFVSDPPDLIVQSVFLSRFVDRNLIVCIRCHLALVSTPQLNGLLLSSFRRCDHGVATFRIHGCSVIVQGAYGCPEQGKVGGATARPH